MSSFLEAPRVDIDPAGDILIEAFESDSTTYDDCVLFRVSSKVLVKSSDDFKEHLEKDNAVDTLGLCNVSVKALELWLRIFHNNVSDEYLYLSIADYEDAIRMGIKYNFDSSKMTVCFSLWLGSQDICEIGADDLRKILLISNELGHDKASELLNIIIEEIAESYSDPNIRKAYKGYPPVPVMSPRQAMMSIFTRAITIPEYEIWGFSSSFRAVYGDPTEYYSDFCRLMTTPFDHSVLPKLTSFASLGEKEPSRFLWFCRISDDIASKKSLPMLTRRQMEAAWCWIAFDLYENELVDYKINHFSLRNVIAKRFHPRTKIEQYWAVKCATIGWAVSEIDLLTNGCEEDAEKTMETPEGDEDEDDDMVMNDEGTDEGSDEGSDEGTDEGTDEKYTQLEGQIERVQMTLPSR